MTEEQVQTVLGVQHAGSLDVFGVIAIQLGFISEETLAQYIQEKRNDTESSP